MRKLALVVCAAAGLAAAFCAHAAPAQGGSMPAPIVFFDIAGPDMARQAAFYRTVFDWDVAPDGRFSAPAAAPPAGALAGTLAGTLRADPADKVLYIGVDDVTATLTRIVANGGQVVAPRFGVKGVVVLGLFTDPAGNRLGLVEMSGGAPKVP
jgi:predicted enzyme related to lactoylglutathione lyase